MKRSRYLSLLLLLIPTLLLAEPVDFSLKGLDGKTYKLSDYRGKWVVVNYWATWCPPCLEEIPELEVFYSNHKNSDAVVLGIALERIKNDRLKAFVEQQFMSYPVLKASPEARPPLGSVPGLPTTYLVDPKGEIVAKQVGGVTREALEHFIDTHGDDKAVENTTAKAD